jgi:S1-C subfamily serine protease
MFHKKDLLILALFCLIAVAVAAAAYVVINGPSPLLTASATQPPAAPQTPVPTVASTGPSPSPLTETPTALPTFTPALVPQFGPVTFGVGVRGEDLINSGTAFPAGTTEVYASWSYRDMREGTPYRLSWHLNDRPWTYEKLAWDAGRYGSDGPAYVAQIGEHDVDGLPPGDYRLELFIDERQVQVATFVILGPTATRPLSSPTPLPTATPLPDMQTIGRRAAGSLVQIWMPGDEGDSRASGSIVDSSRDLILTNWHVVTDDWGDLLNENGYAGIYVTVDPDREPVLTYWAQVRAEYSDPAADLAILRITHWAEDNSPVEDTLDQPPIPLGDSDRVRRGDRVLLLGYPDYAEGTLSWTEGVIATQTDAWIKSGAEASYGHSGGMMLNDGGELIGIIAGGESIGSDGQLTLAIPINIARPLIDRAIVGAAPPPSRPVVDDPATVGQMVVLGAPALNLRAGPDLDNRVIGEMPMGTVVEVLGSPEWDGQRYWHYVRVPETGQEGWASEVYLASWEAATSPILFSSGQAGSLDVYSIFPDGTGRTRLTEAPGDEGDASWSPDYSHIAFTYKWNGDSDLYYMSADGGSWVQLTSDTANDAHPAWSPDGGRIAFVSDRDGDWEIYVLDLATGGMRQVTYNHDWDSFPAWSPDGTRLVFTSSRTGNYDLFVVDVGTGRETQLTTSPQSDAHPAWSPLADEIVYTMVVVEGGNPLREIGMLNVYDPAHPRRLTASDPSKALYRYPGWSPDGRWIVSSSGGDRSADVFLMPARGGSPVRVPNSAMSGDSAPAWSP